MKPKFKPNQQVVTPENIGVVRSSKRIDGQYTYMLITLDSKVDYRREDELRGFRRNPLPTYA